VVRRHDHRRVDTHVTTNSPFTGWCGETATHLLAREQAIAVRSALPSAAIPS
jgi:hypothetical protein